VCCERCLTKISRFLCGLTLHGGHHFVIASLAFQRLDNLLFPSSIAALIDFTL